jgi:hypothetical protein
MSGSLVGGVVGAVIGYFSGGLLSPANGWLIGSVLGSLADSRTQVGPSLTDLRPQGSEYGRPIPIVYSPMGVGGNVIWASDLVKTSDGSDGGKGGGGDAATGPTYAANVAILICESDGDHSLGRIWAGPDKRLVYDPATQKLESGTLRFYDGAADQMPDPLMESYLGAGNVPAYRGFAYVVLEGFDVSQKDGNRIPFFTIEIGPNGATAPEDLGQAFIEKVIDASPHFITCYWGSFHGELWHAQDGLGFEYNRQIDDWQFSDIKFWDSARSVFVRGHKGPANYVTTVMSTGAMTVHSPFSLAAGELLQSGLYFNDRYVFVTSLSGGGSKFYTINPDTHTIVSTQTFDVGSTFSIVDIYSQSSTGFFVYGVTTDLIRLYSLDGVATTSGSVGAPASTAGGNAAACDPNTGFLWTVVRSDYTVSWSLHDTSGVVNSDSMSMAFFSLAAQPLFFIPALDGVPALVGIAGQRWLAVDHYVLFIAETGVVYNGEFDGVYHGTNPLDAVMWDSAMGTLVGFREGGFFSIGSGPDPALIPYAPVYMSGASASLSYLTLAEVVTDLSLRAGLTVDDIDVSQLTDQVDGYTIANQVTVKDAIAALMPAYFFDAVESQGKIKFVKRGGGIAAEIPDEDLGAHPSGEDAEAKERYHTIRVMDDELPRTLSVTYVLAATKYSPDTKYSRRLVGYSGDAATHDFAMVFTGEKAQQIADVVLHSMWVERLTYKFSLPRKYGFLEPTDIVGIDGYTMRITKQTEKDGYYECEAVRDDANVYTPNVIVTETPPPDETVVQPSLTLLELM